MDRDELSALADRIAAWLAVDPEEVMIEPPRKGRSGRISLKAEHARQLLDEE